MREFSVIIGVIVILIILYFAIGYLGISNTGSNNAPAAQQNTSRASERLQSTQPKWSWGSFSSTKNSTNLGYEPDTAITAGPSNDSLVDAEEITINFTGILLNGIDDVVSSFEYKINNSNWSGTYANFYKIKLIPGEITFAVRAKTKKGAIDSSPATLTFQSNLSQWYNKIKVSQIKKPVQGDELSGLIYLSNGSRETANLNNWKMRTKEGTFAIPGAVEYFRLQETYSPSPINFGPNQVLIISNKLSPLATSFRINKCSGYLINNFNFIPTITKKCPLAKNYDLSSLTDRCQTYINRISACGIPQPTANDIGVTTDSACMDFLNKLNYGSCYNRHYIDIDFFINEWRLFASPNSPIIRNAYEEIRLYDNENKLVDVYKY